jgi:hypothetical protein
MRRVVVIDRDRIIRTGLLRLIEELGPTLSGIALHSLDHARRDRANLAGTIVLVDVGTEDGAAAEKELAGACAVVQVPVRRSASGVRRLAHGRKLTELVATLRQQA